MSPLKQNFTRLMIVLIGVMILLVLLSTSLAGSANSAHVSAWPDAVLAPARSR